MRRLLLATAVATLVLAAACQATFPAQAPLGPGWHTPILAAELARTPADLAFLAGDQAEPIRAAMDAGHRVDALFPWAYGCLLAASAWSARARSGVLAAAVAVSFDTWENALLTVIVDSYRHGGQAASALAELPVTTWIKWAALAWGLAAVGVAERHARPFQAAALGLASVGVALAWSTGLPVLGELMGLSVVVGFVTLAVRAVRGPLPPSRLSQGQLDSPPRAQQRDPHPTASV